MIRLKSKEEIETMKEGGRRHALILRKLADMVGPGVTSWDLDQKAVELVKDFGDTASFLNYTPEGVSYPYPATVCISVNEEVVHGIPSKDVVFQEGDLVSIDLGLTHDGLITDGAITVAVGIVDSKIQHLMDITKKALEIGIEKAVVGNTVGDIGEAIGSFAEEQKLGIIRVLSGHGVGYAVHEDPYVPNFGKKGQGEKLVAGMVLAIEPMFTLGGEEVVDLEDEYTYITEDGSLSAHFEHTIAITEEGPVILTKE
jgi:methionyl aminopeptidase